MLSSKPSKLLKTAGLRLKALIAPCSVFMPEAASKAVSGAYSIDYIPKSLYYATTRKCLLYCLSTCNCFRTAPQEMVF